ncbi:MAG: O-antigen ligase family protein [Gammaproteobacteria bacterium]|nr:O-antigen ligase family protein [Gammaproteobacteria bacterium]
MDYGNSLIKLPRMFSLLLILFLAMQIKYYKQQYFIINSAITACFIVVIIGLLQSIGFNPFNIHYPGLPASTFINPNHASNYIEFFIPILLILILYIDNRAQKILYSTVLVLSITFLYILSSLGTLIALLLAILISATILFKYADLPILIKKNKKYLAVICISSISFIALYNSHPSYNKLTSIISSKTSIATPKNSHVMRLYMYLQAIDAIRTSPFTGVGYGGFRAGFLPFIAKKQNLTKHSENNYYFELHNDFLQQALETGIISGIVFFLFFVYVIYIGFSTIKHKRITEKNIFIFSISAGLLVILFHAFVSFPFHLSNSSLLIYLVTGFILSTKTKKIFIKTTFPPPLFTLPLLIFFSFALIFSSTHNTKHLQSNKLIRDAYIALYKEKNCKQAINLIDKSNQLFKFDFKNQLHQTEIYNTCPQPLLKLQIILDNLINLSPTNLKAHFLRGRVAILENKLGLAYEHFYYITEMLPYSSLGYIGLGDWAYQSKQLAHAKTYYKKALSLDPENAHVLSKIKALNNS